MVFCFFKQKTAYEMRISDWSSDVCSSDLTVEGNMPRKRKPSASVAGRKGAVAACAATPSSAMATKQKARLPACSFQLRMPCRSEEHTSELQSLMRISYAVFCLKKKTK